jgi:arylsulfatase A-like enzyme
VLFHWGNGPAYGGVDEVVVFSDAALEAAVRGAIGIPSAPLLVSDLASTEFTALSADAAGIRSLGGIEYCVNLTSLSLADNAIEDIGPLAGLRRLGSLNLAGNAITDASPLTTNAGLGTGDEIDLSDNPLNLPSLCVEIPALTAWGANVAHTGICPEDFTGPDARHTADRDGSRTLGLNEVLRVVQFFNAGAYSCDAVSEDGFAPGAGDTGCAPHASDFLPHDWQVNLSELLRVVQHFNSRAYYPCPGGEDGFCAGDAAELPNVVLLVLETTRASRIGAKRNGIPIAPFMESLAAQGAKFTQAITQSTWTNPSVAGLFTGVYPNVYRESMVEGRYNILENSVTIGEWFAGFGYDCRGFQTNGWASEGLGFAQGFPEGRYEFLNVYPAALLNDAALESLPQWEEPFFTYMQFMDPHSPYAPPAEYAEIFGPPPPLPAAVDRLNLNNPMIFEDYLTELFRAWLVDGTPNRTLTEAGIAAMAYRYDAEIRYLDDQLKRLVEAIQAEHPNTIFVIVSDHGEALQDREQLIGHGHTLFDEQANVPLIMNGPGIAPRVVDTPVETIGILPTLARLMGVPPHPQWQSRDCLAQADTPGPVYSHAWVTFEGNEARGDAVWWNGLKYVEHSKLGTPHLFDVNADPGETVNLAESRPDDAAALSELLHTHLDRVEPEISEKDLIKAPSTGMLP